jgi:hypothetical protein
MSSQSQSTTNKNMTRKKYTKLLERISNLNADSSPKAKEASIRAKELLELKAKYDKFMKERFNFFKKFKTKSYKGSPFMGKNKAQRSRLSYAFSNFRKTDNSDLIFKY